ncbi:hypothetical protein DN752_07425 [Echinicola strongylocentroti]|uniref:Collagen triple helix repeat-containing protein n=1 Tax=Echinicola strongylocentroti TaxID=1795355 RepID=A0A2Z4IGY4_9BACT|nr:hypothetical protein [Echinicola strongylocentroti]AWW29967.1 hypothetical protein DN752_07425 [Echinicola strongylocentroti]
MKNLLLVLLFCLGAGYANAQVGIGTTTPNPSSQLEIVSSDRGVLIPRIALVSVTDNETISQGNVESLLVFNTTDSDLISPGYYYWFENKWMGLKSTGDDANNVIFDPEKNQFFYVNEEGDLVHIAISDLLQETTSTLEEKENGTYLYTNENGEETIINVPSDVVNNFTEIINNVEILNELVTIIEKNGGNVYYDGDSFSYTNEKGDLVEISIESLLDETTSTLVDNGDGTYSYTNEVGLETIINVPADVIKKFGDIVNNETVNKSITELIKNVGGNVYYDGDNITYADEEGDEHVINIEEIVKEYETVTTLVDNGVGTYTYTSENNTEVSFDVTRSGTGNPGENGTVGEAGDVYVDESTGDVYSHDGTAWTKVGGEGDLITVDEGDPNDNGTPGEAGDVYIDNSTGATYVINPDTGEWEQATDGITVADGKVTHRAVDGTEKSFDVTQSGTGNPGENGTVGEAGDVYVDESTGDVYSHDGTAWTKVGGEGDLITVDEGDPNDNGTPGEAGDVYIDNSTGATYVINPDTGEWEQATDGITVADGKVTHRAVDGTEKSFDVTRSGTGNPGENGTVGEAGDVYVDESTGDVYSHDGTAWTKVGGEGDLITVDEGDPNDNGTPGEAGDVYIDNSTGATYVINPDTGEWEQATDGITVADGKVTHRAVDGTEKSFDVTQSGTGNPGENGTVGEAGDVYVDESTGDVYSHDGTAWTKVGGEGDLITVDEGDPNDNGTPGEAGDVYIDNSTGATYVINPDTGEWEQTTDGITVADGKVTHRAVDGTEKSFDVTRSGTGNPGENGTVGEAGDVYVDESTGDVYSHDGTAWTKVGGEGDLITVDEGDPNDNGTPGEAGDVYIDNSTGATYVINPDTGEWEQATDGITVADGKVTHRAVDGTEKSFDVTQSGTGNPGENGTVGEAGDVYVDESTGDVYSHDGTAWTKVGGEGDLITVDEGDPNDNGTPGEAGDVYIDNSTGATYVINPDTGEWEQTTDGITVADGKVTHRAVDGTEKSFDVTRSGTGNPGENGTVGEAGDVYVDESNGTVYTFVENPDGDLGTDDAAWVQSNVAEPWQVSGTTNKATENNQDIYQMGKIGVGNDIPTERLHVSDGGVKVDDINPTDTEDTYRGTLESAADGQKDRVVVAAADGTLKTLKAMLQKFFFMPSVLIPVNEDQVESGDTFGTIDLYSKYLVQFGTPMVSSANAVEGIPILPADELEYHITWFDEGLFENVQVSEAGVLTYDVIDGAEVNEGSFMNIVFVVKE